MSAAAGSKKELTYGATYKAYTESGTNHCCTTLPYNITMLDATQTHRVRAALRCVQARGISKRASTASWMPCESCLITLCSTYSDQDLSCTYLHGTVAVICVGGWQ